MSKTLVILQEARKTRRKTAVERGVCLIKTLNSDLNQNGNSFKITDSTKKKQKVSLAIILFTDHVNTISETGYL